ncbi:AI-2E family transporter [Brochothrix thermosphacta]|uniref:AI-2E family transporter n=1 Tax=Brochothrix thermosphacta TaxID=2756 RepID=UPI00083F6749|nr:AI-2E family transporter [Brochothrix thermosphacta]ODJ50397.1 AI-2E family transporter [Brochothrix thermosphacta]
MFKNSKLFFWTVEILAIALLLYLFTQMSFLFGPIRTFISTIFMPMLLAGFIFYMLNPVVGLIEKLKVKRIWAIVIVFFLIIGVIGLFAYMIFPPLANQLVELGKAVPGYWSKANDYFDKLLTNPQIQNLDIENMLKEANLNVSKIVNSIISNATSSITSIIGVIASVTITIVTVPFIVFFMFKDGHKFSGKAVKCFPRAVQEEAGTILSQMSKTISSYISGQTLDCLCVGILTFVGYLIIGQPYALLLGVIAGSTNIIPYLGPWIGLLPAVIIGIFISPWQAIAVIIVVLIVQQIDSNIMNPLIVGRSLNVHPLTIIIVLLVAGNLAGLLGMLLAVPTYAVAKTVIINIAKMWRLNKESRLEVKEP